MKIDVPQHELARYCKHHRVRRLSFFGSVLREDFGPTSDVDVLVEFERGQVPGFLHLARMERELSDLLGGRRVDLHTPQSLSRYFRDDVLARAEVHYAGA